MQKKLTSPPALLENNNNYIYKQHIQSQEQEAGGETEQVSRAAKIYSKVQNTI